MENKYDDIINMPHHISVVHPRMDIIKRAAQFAPFAALTGYEEAIDEVARRTNRKIDLDENAKAILDEKLQIIQNNISSDTEVTITYFKPDVKKEGGQYLSVSGIVKKIDIYARTLILQDKSAYFIEDIYDLQSDLFYKKFSESESGY